MYRHTREGRWDEARAIWDRILPLEEVVYGQPVRDYRARTKVALRELGVIESTVMRPPLLPVGEETEAAVRDALRAARIEPVGVA
jgi:4-hydroxy-tetrahydrodipicolinate synthase